MSHTQKVHFRRELVPGMAPVGVGKDAQLAAFDQGLNSFLHRPEITDGVLRPAGESSGEVRRLLRVSPQGADHVNPIQGVQDIEMDHVVLQVVRAEHQVPDKLGIRRDGDTERVLHGAHGSQRVHGRADPAGAFGEGPGVPRVSASQDDLQPADHCPCGKGVGDHSPADIGLNPQVALDPSNGVNDDSFGHHAPPSSFLPVLRSLSLRLVSSSFLIRRRFRRFVATACTAMPPAAAAAR